MKKLLLIILISSITNVFAQEKKHTVSQGETLYAISKKYSISVDQLKKWNDLKTNDLTLGQELVVSKSPENLKKTHVVKSGETLYSISKLYNVSLDQIKKWNKLESESLSLGQTLIINNSEKVVKVKKTHIVQSGETLYSISQDYSMSVEDLIKVNKLESNSLSIGQQLIVTDDAIKTEEKVQIEATNLEIKEQAKQDIVHTVGPKETLFSISRIYGVSVNDIKKLNDLTTYEISIGQKLVIQDKKSKPSEIESAEPTFLSKELGTASLNFSSSISHNKYSYCLHKNLKVGTIVKITNTDSNDFIYARVMGSLISSDQDLVGINKVIVDKIGNGLNTFPTAVEYVK